MKKYAGYTIIEIMVTLIVMASILGLGVFTMMSYMPRQRLLDSLETTEQMLSRAQFEASARSTWSCVQYVPGTNALNVFMDADGNHGAAAATCGTGADFLITSQRLKDSIGFADSICCDSGDCAFNFVPQPIWFNSAGVPQDCTSGSCIAKTYQIIVTSLQLSSSNKAREVEAISSGLISIVARGEKGYLTTIFALTPTTTGSGSCE